MKKLHTLSLLAAASFAFTSAAQAITIDFEEFGQTYMGGATPPSSPPSAPCSSIDLCTLVGSEFIGDNLTLSLGPNDIALNIVRVWAPADGFVPDDLPDPDLIHALGQSLIPGYG